MCVESAEKRKFAKNTEYIISQLETRKTLIFKCVFFILHLFFVFFSLSDRLIHRRSSTKKNRIHCLYSSGTLLKIDVYMLREPYDMIENKLLVEIEHMKSIGKCAQYIVIYVCMFTFLQHYLYGFPSRKCCLFEQRNQPFFLSYKIIIILLRALIWTAFFFRLFL